ncbi:hydroxymethylglutaryl-CoA lyase [Leptospira interrogans]|uniref:2-isopropylmalate synthase n=12 Tax=Leptospira interrogans TaxID=173 RepID=Q8F7U7_LEPIN|nr:MULTISPECIES: hydroxymethylglutaryl-CoA lyase [Leptospira]EMF42787.1 HMGL-like protein [Leptospira interrogans serovar Lora str. TE 1992]EMF73011.1 HMGL-like protein [Leptospira interrogans serovar Canicola str. LT1962]EMG21308.1 HMGL-like protein [Leptospira interrogans serovar Copenhageni str. LT2050]EMM96909.1 HMGL-like protein [Leptospira interrogans serovar Zanoni str. LT2156]EMN32310.1 HMGL-like protein [Leptospira interrogans serovar Pyrogenes str. L0374]EMN72575.1 HMGL-like protein
MEIKITEVGPRDGLQNEKSPVSTEVKAEFIQRLVRAGLKNIEATSFVKKDSIPQLADATELSAFLDLNGSVSFSALTPNLKGYEAAKSAGYKEVAVFTAASESFTKKNINRTISESIEGFKDIFNFSKIDGIQVRGYVSTVIDCPYEGKMNPKKVLEVSKILLDLGAYEISLGETIGTGVPTEVEKLLEVLLKEIPANKLAGHFHDTYGMAIANVEKAYSMGLRSFDSSAGGLGGCPYAKGAAGNLATDDLVYFLEKSGISTGIDPNLLWEASLFMEKSLSRELQSRTFLATKKKRES